MNRLYRTRNRKRIAVCSLCVMTAVCMTFLAYATVHLWQYCENLKIIEKQLESYKKQIYVCDRELSAGMILSRDMVRLETHYTDRKEEEFIREEDFGKVLDTDVSEGEFLLENMLLSPDSGIREVFVADLEIAEHLETGDRVDIRIRFPNAEDYIVLADKLLVTCDRESGLVLRLTEEEILLLSSAVLDAEQYHDTRLYAVKYLKQEPWEATMVTYIPERDILLLLEEESSKGELREALERRLGYEDQ